MAPRPPQISGKGLCDTIAQLKTVMLPDPPQPLRALPINSQCFAHLANFGSDVMFFLNLISAGGLSKRSLPFLLFVFSASGLSARSPFFLSLSASGLSKRSPLAFLCFGQLFEQELAVFCCSRVSCLSYIDTGIIIYKFAGCLALAVCTSDIKCNI